MGGLFKGEEIQCSHILVKDKMAAEKVLADVKNGGSFEALAKQNSTCPSGSRGGDLGKFSKGAMVPEFETAAFNLKPGEVSGLVQTQFGWHIIKRTA